MTRPSRRIKTHLTLLLAFSLALPAVALGAGKPNVATGGVAKLTPSTVSLLGKVNANGEPTAYVFQYGPTSLYGAQTATASAGTRAKAINVVADIGGLAPATKYHYRIVASNSHGTRGGKDRTFKTKPQPLGLTLAATPDPVPFGMPTVLGGSLTGTGNAGRQVVLQSNPFPYTQGFVNTTVPLNTQYRVLIPTKPEISSPIVSVGVAVKVSTSVTDTRVRRHQRVRFTGTVKPGKGGERIAIQKLKPSGWVTLAGTITHRASSTSSRYSRRIRINRAGSYRVYVAIADGSYVSSTGRTVKIHLGG